MKTLRFPSPATFVLASSLTAAAFAGSPSWAARGEGSGPTATGNPGLQEEVAGSEPAAPASQPAPGNPGLQEEVEGHEAVTPSSQPAAEPLAPASQPAAEPIALPVTEHIDRVEANLQSIVLTKLHMANQQEIKLGNMAAVKAINLDVRSYGRMLALQHTANDEKVLSLVQRESLALVIPDTTAERLDMQDAKATEAYLSSLSGIDFDRAFILAMIKNHTKAIVLMQAAKAKLPAGSVRDLVTATLPALFMHLSSAQDLQNKYFPSL